MKNKILLIIGLVVIIVVSLIIDLTATKMVEDLFVKAGAVFTELFLIALIIERGLDVFLTNLRASDSERLQNQISELQNQIEANPGLIDSINQLKSDLYDYKANTRFYAMRAGLIIGILISTIGFRTLQNLIDPISFNELESFQKYAIYFFDISLTGAVLAGGSDQIHKMMDSFRLFMEKK